jgi:hypothetical protein
MNIVARYCFKSGMNFAKFCNLSGKMNGSESNLETVQQTEVFVEQSLNLTLIKKLKNV